MSTKSKSKSSIYSFKAILDKRTGSFFHTVIVIPDKIVRKLPQDRRLRTQGTLNGAPFSLAVQKSKNKPWFFMVGGLLRKAARIKAGDEVDVKFWLVDPNVVELPEELEVVLDQDNDGMKAWKNLTPGLQRSAAFYVSSIKNVDGRIKRALETVERIKSGQIASKKKSG